MHKIMWFWGWNGLETSCYHSLLNVQITYGFMLVMICDDFVGNPALPEDVPIARTGNTTQ